MLNCSLDMGGKADPGCARITAARLQATAKPTADRWCAAQARPRRGCVCGRSVASIDNHRPTFHWQIQSTAQMANPQHCCVMVTCVCKVSGRLDGRSKSCVDPKCSQTCRNFVHRTTLARNEAMASKSVRLLPLVRAFRRTALHVYCRRIAVAARDKRNKLSGDRPKTVWGQVSATTSPQHCVFGALESSCHGLSAMTMRAVTRGGTNSRVWMVTEQNFGRAQRRNHSGLQLNVNQACMSATSAIEWCTEWGAHPPGTR